ncbi:efflux RND transporter periplasmic adaptor subunit [bacterium]|nr:efflux RND transporter periplasmic adaptor subunit [bacterium]
MSKHIRLSALGLIAIAMGAALLMPPRLPAAQSAAETPEVGVFEAALRKTTVAREYVGRIEADTTVEIRARIEGFLDRQLFKDGSMVKAGELLFLIDPRQYESQVSAARARLAKAKADLVAARANVELVKARADLVRDKATLANAEKDLARVKPLAEASAVSQQELDQADTKVKEAAAVVEAARAVVRQAEINQESNIALAEADVQQTSATLSNAELNLSYTRVQSPIDGLIGKAEVNVGSLVGPGTSISLLATVSQLDPIKVYFSLSEQEYLAVMRALQERGETRKGILQFELLLSDGQLYGQKGQFDFAERAVDAKTGTLQVRAVFPNKTQLLRPGQFARVRVTNPDAPASLMIPQRAVMDQQGEQFVMVVDGRNQVERRKVRLGARVETQWIVLDGLRPGERVITDGLQKVRPGMTVKALKTEV